MDSLGRSLVSLDQGWAGALYRVAIGYLIVPAWSSVMATTGQSDSGWSLALFFAGVLLALRVVPAVVRKLLPFSAEVRTIWAERRQMAKRVDSYQWRKLFWIGIGLGVFALQSGLRLPALLALTSACLLAGAAGLIVWQYRVSRQQAREV